MRAFFLLFAIFACFSMSARAQDKPLVVLEFFTSQNCSGGAELEGVLEDVIAEQTDNVLVLSCHVKYMDSEDMQDVFGLDLCEDRQDDYEDPFDFMSQPTMPQLVVNGRHMSSGLDIDIIRSSIKMAEAHNQIVPVQISLRDNILDVSLPKIRSDEPLYVWLFGYDHLQKARANVGDRAGKKERYKKPVRYIKKLFKWDGDYKNMSISVEDVKSKGYAIIVQPKSFQGIAAAGYVER